MIKIKYIFVIVLMCSSSILLAKSNSVRIAFFPNITHAQALLGKHTGTFEKYMGVKVDWKQFNAGSSEIEAMMAGEIDLGYIGPGPAVNGAIKTCGDIIIIGGATNGGAVLVSRKDIKLNGIKSLFGKKIAVPQFGNTQDLMLRYMLQKNGLKDTTHGGTVEILQVENPDIKLLFDQRAIDAAFLPEPWGSRVIKESNANLVLDNHQLWQKGQYPTTVIIARTDFLKKNPDLVQRFINAHVALTQQLNVKPDNSKQIINEEIEKLTGKKISSDIIKSSFKRLTSISTLNISVITVFTRMAYDIGFIKKMPDNLNKYINLTFLKNAKNQKPISKF